MNTQVNNEKNSNNLILHLLFKLLRIIFMFLFLTIPSYIILVYAVEHQWILSLQQLILAYNNAAIHKVMNIILIIAIWISLIASILT